MGVELYGLLPRMEGEVSWLGSDTSFADFQLSSAAC